MAFFFNYVKTISVSCSSAMKQHLIDVHSSNVKVNLSPEAKKKKKKHHVQRSFCC